MHLLKEVTYSHYKDPVSRAFNKLVDLTVHDSSNQDCLVAALRQQSPDFAHALLDVVEHYRRRNPRVTEFLPELNKQNEKHGYPLHISIFFHKLEVTLRMLKLGVDSSVLTSIGANIIHLLFVQYDKDPVSAFQIMEECVKLGVNFNLVDSQKAAPIHLALRKRQYVALQDCLKLNRNRQVIDFNLPDKNGNTALHYACDK